MENHESDDDKTIYKVVVNDEEQYSIWRSWKVNPLGWRDEGTSGSREDCLARIEKIWTDMRPLSLRKRMDAGRSKQP
jgi:MbtH protein